MGCLGSKDRLTKEDMEFLKTHTRYDEVTIKEWYKGFKVSSIFLRLPKSVFMNWAVMSFHMPIADIIWKMDKYVWYILMICELPFICELIIFRNWKYGIFPFRSWYSRYIYLNDLV